LIKDCLGKSESKVLPKNNLQTTSKYGGAVLKEGISNVSSLAAGPLNQDGRVVPLVTFQKCHEYYQSSPRVYNTTESFVLDIRNRGFHWDGDAAGIKTMEEWEKTAKPKRMFAKMIRNLMVCGTHLISWKDWMPLQLSTVIAKIRDPGGETKQYIQRINGIEIKLDAEDFIEIGLNELDREPWGMGAFHSLFYDDYFDIDGSDPRPVIELQRQSLQDQGRILHKLAAPRAFYNIEGVDSKVLDNDIIPVLEAMKPGDRAAFNAKIEPVVENLGSTRFPEYSENIKKEVDVGVGSSKNRLITEPSAMADAKEANKDDDDRILGLLDILKEFMDFEVIPRITGLELGKVEFKWGNKDTFRIELPEAIEKAITLKLITVEKAIEMLQQNFKWPKIETKDIPQPEPEIPNQIIPDKEERSKMLLLRDEIKRFQEKNR